MQRIGGIPFLKDLPFIGPMIRDIPILGYYVKTGGSGAVRQESLIFAQTSIYPTVGDIVDLVYDVPSRIDIDSRDIPDYLKGAFNAPKPTIPPEPSNAVLATLRPDPDPVIIGSPTVGTVALSAPADDDIQVLIQSGDGIVQPAAQTITILKGQMSALFALKTVGVVKYPVTIAVTATANRISKIVLLTVQPVAKPGQIVQAPAVADVKFTPSPTVGGAFLLGTVTLAEKAPVGGAVVALAVNDLTLGQIPDSVEVSPGLLSATFRIDTSPVDQPTSVVITATSGKISKTSAFILISPRLQALTITPNDGSETYTAAFVLEGDAASHGVAVRIRCDDSPFLLVDTTVIIPAGRHKGQITLQPRPFSRRTTSPQVAHLRVTANGVTRTETLILHR